MKMRQNLQDIFKVLSQDETLLRLLYYLPQNAFDDPLDPTKTDVLSMPNKWDIIADRIKTTQTTDTLDTEPKCRVCFYAGRRKSHRGNYLVAKQHIIFDVYVHFSFDNVDQRLSWICDRLNDLLFNQKITRIGNVDFQDGIPIVVSQNLLKYMAYRLVFEIDGLQSEQR